VLKFVEDNFGRRQVDSLTAASSALRRSILELCGKKDETSLDQARTAWLKTYMRWNESRPVLFGDTAKNDTKRFVFYRPIYTNVLELSLEPGAPKSALDDRTVRGLSALEYLLYPESGTPGGVSTITSSERCNHLVSVADEVASRIAQLQQSWSNDFVSYADVDGKDRRLSILLAEQLNTLEELLWQRLGEPSGFFQREIEVDKLEAWRSGKSLSGLKMTLHSLNVLIEGEGQQNPGYAALLVEVNQTLAQDLIARSRGVMVLANSIEAPLHKTMGSDLGAVKRLFDAISELKEELLAAGDALELALHFEEDGD
jgi:predicted lipoprotein